MPQRILIVDDEPNITASFASLLSDEGYRTDIAATAEEALRKCEASEYDLVLLDLNLPGRSGTDFLKTIKDETSPPLVLVISGQSDIPTALQALKLGAVDYLEKPVGPERLISSVGAVAMLAAAQHQRSVMAEEIDSRSTIVGVSKPVKALLKTIRQAAPTDVTVLITGENGTGKELVATRVFLESARRERPFVKVNCPGVPETLFESELFGHRKGSFTGAVRDYPGKFVMADGGTIFLDEIGDLPRECQSKLLRVLETGEVETLGSVENRQVDARVICASNRDLPRLISEGRFREDLYYRISVFVIDVPPLRRRAEDIPLLAGEFLRRFDPSGSTRLAPEAVAFLATLDYPGNIRQLKNIIERLTIVCQGRTVSLEDLNSQLGATGLPDNSGGETLSLSERLARFERQLIRATLDDCEGNISKAARLLQIDRGNLSRKIKELGLKKS